MEDNRTAPGWVVPAKIALLFAWLLAAICAYYVLRPVRSAMVMADFGPRILPWVYMGTALCTGIAVWLYSLFTHLPRKRLIGGLIAFFLANFVVLWWFVRDGAKWLSPVLYVWTDVFSIMSTTIFWTYADDVFSGDEAKRHFGKIGAAGMVGAFIGAGLTKTFVETWGVPAMLLVAGGIYALILGCMLALERLTDGRSAPRVNAIEGFDSMHFGDLPSILRSILASRTLTLLVAVVCMERFVPDFVDYIFSSAMHAAYPERASYARVFASFELWRNALVFIGSFFVTSHLLKRGGVHVALTTVPASIVIAGAAYALLPVLGVAILMKGFEEGQRHAWFKAGKETIYTATNKDVIFRAKPYIEMFVYRLARGLAGFILLILTDFAGLGPAGVSVAMLPLAAAWCWITWTLGTDYERLERGAARGRFAEPAPAADGKADHPSLLKSAAV
ncbi:MAG: hypothetical protein HY553_10955 [Elusimicrobia bacterium]|nr:hypothetical protein [Elusimicrobiota bacterium]